MTEPLSFRSIPTFRDLQGRFARADKELLEARRDLMRDLGRRMAELSRAEAPVRTGKFQKSLGFRTFAQGQDFGFRIYMAQPLGAFILEGTQAHVISARRALALRFEWHGEIVFFKSVNHPGTKPNRFTSRAWRKWLPESRAGLRRISLRYQQTLTAKGGSGRT